MSVFIGIYQNLLFNFPDIIFLKEDYIIYFFGGGDHSHGTWKFPG